MQINVAIYHSANAERRCNKLRLKAGQLLLQLRQRIEAGEEGDVSWWEWPLMQRLKSSTKRMHGRASDPRCRLCGAGVGRASDDATEKTSLDVAPGRPKRGGRG